MGSITAGLSNIYIVDDDRSFGTSLRRLLRARGFSVAHFRSAQSFLDSVPPGQRGCAIVDIHMPECDGFALIDKMHALNYAVHVIVITGRASVDTGDLALQRGALGLLHKPFSEVSLLRLLDKA